MFSSKQALHVLLLLCWAVRQGLCDAASEAGSVSRTPFDYHAQNKQLHVDREMALRVINRNLDRAPGSIEEKAEVPSPIPCPTHDVHQRLPAWAARSSPAPLSPTSYPALVPLRTAAPSPKLRQLPARSLQSAALAMRPYSLGNVKRKASFLRTAGTALASAGGVTSVLVVMLFPAIGSFAVSVKCPPMLEVLKLEKPFVGVIQYHIDAAQAFVLLAFSTLYALLAVTISMPLALLSTAFFMLPTPFPMEFTTLLALLPLIGLASLWGRLWAGPGQAADAGESMGARAEP